MDFNLEKIFEIKEEPNNSKKELLKFKEKYQINFEKMSFSKLNINDLVKKYNMSEEVAKDFLHYYRIFVNNGGNINNLQ